MTAALLQRSIPTRSPLAIERLAREDSPLRTPNAPEALDYKPRPAELLTEILQGMSSEPKRIPSKLLYDARGSELFESICETDEYYLTRAELEIMESHAAEMARECGPECLLIEYGSGSGLKTRLLLDRMDRLAGYVPIDISIDALEGSAAALTRDYPDVSIVPVCADYTNSYEIPPIAAKRRIVYFPGSTLGNFEPEQARDFLGHAAETCESGGAMLLGVDLHKDPRILEPAYNDAEGITAEFELNVLARLNREFRADFDLDQFEYQSHYNTQARRVEMYVVSQADQRIRIDHQELEIGKGERIITEHSYKYALDELEELAGHAGLVVERVWLDSKRLFSVQLLSVR